MNIYFVRHGSTIWNEQNRLQGSHNPSLSAEGKRQARQLARRLKREGISRIVASDLLRSRETARLIQKELSVPILYERGLREIDLGAWEGMTPQEINRAYRNGYQKWLKTPSKVRIPKAEAVSRFQRRVLKTFKRLLKRKSEGNLLIVTHGGVIAAVLSRLLKGDRDQFLIRLRLDNAGLTEIRTGTSRGTVVTRINDTAHLTNHR